MKDSLIRRYVTIAVSGLVLVAALHIILTDAYPEAHSKWAFGMAGVIVGYWLR